MTPQQAMARARFSSAWHAMRRLETTIGALDDPMALAYVGVAISALDKLDALLEAQEGADGIRHDP